MAIEQKFHTIYDISTGETIVREYTAEEYERDAADNAAAAILEAERLAAEAALATLKASAKAKLIAGQPLTAEEADTLVI